MSHLARWPAGGHKEQHAVQKGAGGRTGTLTQTLARLVHAAAVQKAGQGWGLIPNPLAW